MGSAYLHPIPRITALMETALSVDTRFWTPVEPREKDLWPN